MASREGGKKKPLKAPKKDDKLLTESTSRVGNLSNGTTKVPILPRSNGGPSSATVVKRASNGGGCLKDPLSVEFVGGKLAVGGVGGKLAVGGVGGKLAVGGVGGKLAVGGVGGKLAVGGVGGKKHESSHTNQRGCFSASKPERFTSLHGSRIKIPVVGSNKFTLQLLNCSVVFFCAAVLVTAGACLTIFGNRGNANGSNDTVIMVDQKQDDSNFFYPFLAMMFLAITFFILSSVFGALVYRDYHKRQILKKMLNQHSYHSTMASTFAPMVTYSRKAKIDKKDASGQRLI